MADVSKDDRVGRQSDLFLLETRVLASFDKPREFTGIQNARYFLIQTVSQFREFLELAKKQRIICLDTETSGLSWHDTACGIVVGWGIEHNYYLPIDHKTGEKQLNIEDIREGLQELFGDTNKVWIFANAKFDLHKLRKCGLEVLGVCHDIVIEATLLDENEDHGVKELACMYIDPNADKFEKIITEWRVAESKRRRKEFSDKLKARVADIIETVQGKLSKEEKAKHRERAKEIAKQELADHVCAKNKKEDVTYDYIPLELMTPYACADVHYTFLLWKKFILELAKWSDLKKLYVNEMALMHLLREMEHNGMKVNIPYLTKLEPEFDEEINRLEKEIYSSIGYEFNIGSNDQLIEAFKKVGIQLTKLSKGTKEKMRKGEDVDPKFSVDKEVLEFLAARYPVAELVQKYRTLEKLKSTYIVSLRALVDSNHFVHTNTNQNVRTGRLSMKAPNLENIPNSNKSIRKAFIVPSDEFLLVCFDFSQIELRLTADRSQDRTLLSCYPFQGQGQDVHTLTLAEVVLNKPLDVVKAMKADKNGHIANPQRGESCDCQSCLYDFFRNIAKRVNFGIIYGAGPEAIQRQVSKPTRLVTKEECEEYILKYFRKYPGVKEWIMATQHFMKKNGYVQNTFGRYRRLQITRDLRRWQIERMCRQGVNFLIQGEAADLFKVVAVRIDNILKRENARTRLVNLVHDELQFYWHKEELYLLKEVKAAMEDFNYSVPIVAEIAYSATDWGSKKELKV